LHDCHSTLPHHCLGRKGPAMDAFRKAEGSTREDLMRSDWQSSKSSLTATRERGRNRSGGQRAIQRVKPFRSSPAVEQRFVPKSSRSRFGTWKCLDRLHMARHSAWRKPIEENFGSGTGSHFCMEQRDESGSKGAKGAETNVRNGTMQEIMRRPAFLILRIVEQRGWLVCSGRAHPQSRRATVRTMGWLLIEAVSCRRGTAVPG
jgi:hypothetical protein